MAVVIALTVAGGAAAATGVAQSNENPIEGQLLKASGEINKNLPMMVDSETRLDSTMGMNNTLRYNYTLVNRTADSISGQVLKAALETKLTNNVCSSDDMRIFVSNGVTVQYAYFGKEGTQIGVITIPPSKCQGQPETNRQDRRGI